MSPNGYLRSCPNFRFTDPMIRIICTALLIAPVGGCFGFVWPRDFSGFDEFHIVTNEGPLGVGFPEGSVYEATIRKQEDGRYLLDMSVVEDTLWGVADCPVDIYSELDVDLTWIGSPTATCPVLRELESRFLTDDEAAQIRDLFRAVPVENPSLGACLPGFFEPGAIVFASWDGSSFNDFCCSDFSRPCISRDDTARFYEILFEFAR